MPTNAWLLTGAISWLNKMFLLLLYWSTTRWSDLTGFCILVAVRYTRTHWLKPLLQSYCSQKRQRSGSSQRPSSCRFLWRIMTRRKTSVFLAPSSMDCSACTVPGQLSHDSLLCRLWCFQTLLNCFTSLQLLSDVADKFPKCSTAETMHVAAWFRELGYCLADLHPGSKNNWEDTLLLQFYCHVTE